jgi:hypothetical protein
MRGQNIWVISLLLLQTLRCWKLYWDLWSLDTHTFWTLNQLSSQLFRSLPSFQAFLEFFASVVAQASNVYINAKISWLTQQRCLEYEEKKCLTCKFIESFTILLWIIFMYFILFSVFSVYISHAVQYTELSNVLNFNHLSLSVTELPPIIVKNFYEDNTEEKNNGYVVFKWNIHGSAGAEFIVLLRELKPAFPLNPTLTPL